MNMHKLPRSISTRILRALQRSMHDAVVDAHNGSRYAETHRIIMREGRASEFYPLPHYPDLRYGEVHVWDSNNRKPIPEC